MKQIEKRFFFKSVKIQTKLGINHILNILRTSLDTSFFKTLTWYLSSLSLSQGRIPTCLFYISLSFHSTPSPSVSLPVSLSHSEAILEPPHFLSQHASCDSAVRSHHTEARVLPERNVQNVTTVPASVWCTCPSGSYIIINPHKYLPHKTLYVPHYFPEYC